MLYRELCWRTYIEPFYICTVFCSDIRTKFRIDQTQTAHSNSLCAKLCKSFTADKGKCKTIHGFRIVTDKKTEAWYSGKPTLFKHKNQFFSLFCKYWWLVDGNFLIGQTIFSGHSTLPKNRIYHKGKIVHLFWSLIDCKLIFLTRLSFFDSEQVLRHTPSRCYRTTEWTLAGNHLLSDNMAAPVEPVSANHATN